MPNFTSDILVNVVRTKIPLMSILLSSLVMAALCNRGAIIFLPCSFYLLLSFFFFFFPRLISAAGDWMSTILPHMVWP